MPRPRAKTSLHLRLDFGGERSLGPGKVRLLELIDELNRMFRAPLVASQIGGGGGGGAALTKAGASVIRLYRDMERRANGASSTDIRTLTRLLA